MYRRVASSTVVSTLRRRHGTRGVMTVRSGARPWDHQSAAIPERQACTRNVEWLVAAYPCRPQRTLSGPKALGRRRSDSQRSHH